MRSWMLFGLLAGLAVGRAASELSSLSPVGTNSADQPLRPYDEWAMQKHENGGRSLEEHNHGLRWDRATYEGDPSGQLPNPQLVYQRLRGEAATADGRMALEEQAQAQRGRFYDAHTT